MAAIVEGQNPATQILKKHGRRRGLQVSPAASVRDHRDSGQDLGLGDGWS